MKCHKILGIEENATEQEIVAAYQKRYGRLCNNEELLQSAMISQKSEELMAAKSDCMKWLTLTNSEKKSMRLKESKNSLLNSNVLYSSPIGLCSGACSGACDGYASGGGFCCCDCFFCFDPQNTENSVMGCARIIDIGFYIAMGLLTLTGIRFLAKYLQGVITKCKISKLEDDNRKHREKLGRLIAEINSLQRTLDEITGNNLSNSQNVLLKAQCQYDVVNSFCCFFESLGCKNFEDIQSRQLNSLKRINSDLAGIQEINNIIHKNNNRIEKLKNRLHQ